MRKLLILAALLAAIPSAGQPFKSLGVNEGLGNRKVYQVCQDGEGYIWFYSQNSIDRYDGLSFRSYQLPPEAREGNYIATSNTLSLDREGTLWVAQTNGRVYRYAKEADAFEPAFTAPGGNLYALLFLEGETWLGTSEGLKSLSGEKTFLPERTIHCIKDHAGRLLLGTDQGVYVFNGLEVTCLQEVPPVQVTALEALEDGRIFLGTFSEGAFCYNPSTGKCTPLDQHFPRVPVRTIVKEGKRLLLGTDGAGVIIYDAEASALSGAYTADDSGGGLIANTVSDLLVDRSGILWVTTTTEGISFQDNNSLEIRRIRHIPGESDSLVQDHVNAVLEDSGGRIWMGTNKGLCRYDGVHWKSFDIPGADVILTLAEDENGTIWAGGYGFPVFSVDRQDRVKVLQPDRFLYIFALCVSNNQLWIADTDHSLVCMDLATRVERSFPLTDILGLLPGDGVWSASNLGIHLANPRTGILTPLVLPVEHQDAWCLGRDQKGRLWMGLQSGIFASYNPLTGSIKTYPADNTVYDVLPDKNGKIWAITEDCVYRLDPENSDTPVVMNRFLGIGRGEFNHMASTVLRDGRLVLGTTGGVFVFDPSRIDDAPMGAVTPVITDFRLLSGDTGRILQGKAPDSLDRIVLKGNENSFELDFSALLLQNQPRVRFEYQLKGHDVQPRSSLTAAAVEYTGLKAGRYTFVVEALDTFTGEVLGSRSLPIKVRRPPLLTGWAFLIYGLVLAFFLGELLLLRRRQRENKLARERIYNFISFAHDIKTPVTLIKAPLSDMELSEGLSPESRESLKVARKNADKLMSMLNSLLQLKEFESGEEVLEVSPCTLESYIEEHLDDYYLSAQSKGISLEQDTAKGPHTVFTDVRKLDMILGNLLSNALKYTEKGSITVRTATEGSRWTLEVEDTGIGIPEESRKLIFKDAFRADNARSADNTGYGIGLLITRQLVRSLHGSIRYEAGEEGGSRFLLNFPQHYKAGKQVRIKEAMKEEETPAPALVKPEEDIPATLLLVEDDPETLQYLSSALGQQYTILMADNGLTAYDLALEKNPDLIITDLVMPRLSGDELCRRIKGAVETSHIPVILLTAMGEKENIILGLEAGADDYIVKPFDMGVLRARIRNLFKQRSQLQAAIVMDKVEDEEAGFGNELDRRFMKKVQSVVGLHLSDADFQVADLCKEMAMSRSSLFNKLKSLTGEGPNDYIRIFRLNRAHELLLKHTLSIAEVADAVGFSDAKYFSVCFKKQFGVSPSRV